MEEVADIEMPSCKRLRVEASEQGAIPGPCSSMDDFDDIYGTPSKAEEEVASGLLLPASTKMGSPSTKNQTPLSLPTLPNLPGLGTSQNDLRPADGIAQVQMQEPCHTVSQEPASIIKVTDQEDGEAEIPKEIDNHEERELMEVDVVDSTSGAGEQTDAAQNNGQNGREQESREKILSTTFDRPENAADKSASEVIGPVSFEATTGKIASFQAEEEVSVEAPNEDLPSESSSQLPKAGVPVQDPLAFLEASLPQAPCREADSEALKLGIREQGKTGAESRPMIEAPPSEHLVTLNKNNTDAEFELDSSPLNSDSDLSDNSSQSSSDDADDYKMLDPEEQARRLMAEDGVSDEEGGGGKGKTSGPLRTQNEKADEYVAKPDVVITEEMKIEELGSVEGTIENLVLIKAKTSGEYQVLEQGSVLCLADRSVVGVIAETLGRVHQPYYSVRFTNAAAISEAGLFKDTKIFHVEQYSIPVFTQPLKAFKGSDASNLHDEEVGDDELEFSDDEAEAEYKRRVKVQRQQKRMGRDGQSEGFSRGPRGGRGAMSRGGGRGRTPSMQNGFGVTPELQEQAPNPTEGGLNYDDVGNDMGVDAEDLYTPLARPMNLHEVAQPPVVPTGNAAPQRAGDRGGHGRGRGRGARGGSRGFGRGRGQVSGGFESRGGHCQPNGFQPSPVPSSTNGLPPRPSQQGNGLVTPLLPPQQNHYTATISNQQPYPSFPNQYAYQWNPHQAFPYPPSQQQHSPNAYQTQRQQQQQQSSHAQPSLAQPQNPSPNNPSIPPGAYINPAFFRQSQQWPPGNHQQTQL